MPPAPAPQPQQQKAPPPPPPPADVSFKDESGETFTYPDQEFKLITDRTGIVDRNRIFKTLRSYSDNTIYTTRDLQLAQKKISPPSVTPSYKDEAISKCRLDALAGKFPKDYRERVIASARERATESPEEKAAVDSAKYFLGFEITDKPGSDYVYVGDVYQGTLAVDAGFKKGDMIKKVNGQVVTSVAQAVAVIANSGAKVRDVATFEVVGFLDLEKKDIWLMTGDKRFEGKPYYFDQENAKPVPDLYGGF